ncbi:baseplate J/gp47 family protein [Hymenobacter terricola]|uniref:baseplate J/gp47 family protein n=1 Tax=Hymenobacter terricola TaxID=2819236 RepID=UPI001B312045|nr:baseplate J/gp47 family protein [Hymenobacter terricola]
MPPSCPDTNPLRRDGLSQPQRRLAALDPSFVRLDERTGEDLMAFAAAYAAEAGLQFFNPDGTADATTWARLMARPDAETLAALEAKSDFEPHYALFLAFLQLFGLAQEQLNGLGKKHLDFYYHDVLRLTNRTPVPDQVHAVFELAKNVAEVILPPKTELDAGKDALKQPLVYQTLANRVVNRAKIAHQRTVFIDPDSGTIYYAPAANTADGVAAPLPPADPTWNAFGPRRRSLLSCDPPAPDPIGWPEAQVGFALASPVLRLAEGVRKITVTMQCANDVVLPVGLKLRGQLSGAKAWIEAGELAVGAGITLAGRVLTLVLTVPATEKQAVVDFDTIRLNGGYVTAAPVLRCLLARSADYAALRALTLVSVQIDVNVSGLKKSLVLDNDLGKINPEKPFMPFGPVPVERSTFYVGCAEAAAKTLTSVTVAVPAWVGKPAVWSTQFAAYPTAVKTETGLTATVKVQNSNLTGSVSAKLFTDLPAGVSIPHTAGSGGGALFLTSLLSSFSLFGGYVFSGGTFISYSPLLILLNGLAPVAPSVSDSLLKITLDQELGHGLYPKLLTDAVMSRLPLPPGVAGPPAPAKPIPNPPYTPLASELLLSYLATTGEVSLTEIDAAKFPQRGVQLFHQSVFGQAEEHAFLKRNLAFLDNAPRTSAFLLPQLAGGGTFLLGLKDVGPQETVAVLFQVAEGSANPEREPAQVAWSVLSQNQWRPLTVENVLADATNHLLTSGIIEFYLPPETRLDNTLLEAGEVWLKGELQTTATPPTPASIDSVGTLLALRPQAALARFDDRRNDPAHYAAALPPATIAKTRQSTAGLKGVSQPYASFGGQAAEVDAAFYTRVSERLRHKQRTVTIWDYEHLVLQAFPGIYKIKCLNHTRLDTSPGGKLHELAPGYVTVVAVPDLRNAHAINPLEPKVDLNTLASVKTFVQRHAGLLAGVQAVNPAYERVRLRFQVEFLSGYPFATYRKQLQQDLLAYLSPWAFDSSAEIPFGGTLTKSAVLTFIERRPYVDFVTELTMQHLTGAPGPPKPDNETITASDARAVLVSCSSHDIQPFTGC